MKPFGLQSALFDVLVGLSSFFKTELVRINSAPTQKILSRKKVDMCFKCSTAPYRAGHRAWSCGLLFRFISIYNEHYRRKLKVSILYTNGPKTKFGKNNYVNKLLINKPSYTTTIYLEIATSCRILYYCILVNKSHGILREKPFQLLIGLRDIFVCLEEFST